MYLYNGLIFELGLGLKLCNKLIKLINCMFGINILNEFKKYGKKYRKLDIWKVIIINDYK